VLIRKNRPGILVAPGVKVRNVSTREAKVVAAEADPVVATLPPEAEARRTLGLEAAPPEAVVTPTAVAADLRQEAVLPVLTTRIVPDPEVAPRHTVRVGGGGAVSGRQVVDVIAESRTLILTMIGEVPDTIRRNRKGNERGKRSLAGD